MVIEVTINLKQINAALNDIDIKQETSESFACPMLITIEHVCTVRPYLDEDGIPEYSYCHITMLNGESLLAKYDYKQLRQLLRK